MKLIDLLQLSTRMFRARTARTFLTVLGMSIGIGAVLFLFSLGYGLQLALLKHITTPEALLTLDVSRDESSKIILDNKTLQFIEGMDGVEKAIPVSNLQAEGHFKGMTANFDVISSSESYFRFSGIQFNKGRGFEKKNEAVISLAGVQVFGENPDKIIGQKIKLNFLKKNKQNLSSENLSKQEKSVAYEYKIVGIVKGDDNYIYVNMNSLDRSLVDNHYGQIKVKCKNNRSMNLARQKISQKGLAVSSISDLVDQANKVFGVLQVILILFGITSLIISAVGMFNTMSVTFLERTGEIGIMKSIGATDKDLYLIFIVESTIMGFLGGLGGILIGFLGGKAVNGLINLVATRMGGGEINIFFSPWWFIILILIFATLIGFLTGIMPARWASQADPLKALRYK